MFQNTRIEIERTLLTFSEKDKKTNIGKKTKGKERSKKKLNKDRADVAKLRPAGRMRPAKDFLRPL